MSYIPLLDIFTEDEIVRATTRYKAHKESPHAVGSFAKLVLLPEIIQPALERINKSTGQANDPLYMAYMLEYVAMRVGADV